MNSIIVLSILLQYTACPSVKGETLDISTFNFEYLNLWLMGKEMGGGVGGGGILTNSESCNLLSELLPIIMYQ